MEQSSTVANAAIVAGTTAADPRAAPGSFAGRWVMFMRWHDLLFMHWPVPVAALRPLIPPGLEIDTFDGTGWLGVVPFRMTGIRPRWAPPPPRLSAFAELNVRTYVTAPGGGRPGVWFFSLDAASRLAVRMARWLYHLPYYDAAMSVDVTAGGEFRYESTRVHRNAAPAHLKMRYRPTGPARTTRAGDLDHFLTHRMCLYCADARGRVRRGDIDHAAWQLQPAEAEVEANTMAEPLNLALPDTRPVLHFSRRIDAVAWWPRRV